MLKYRKSLLYILILSIFLLLLCTAVVSILANYKIINSGLMNVNNYLTNSSNIVVDYGRDKPLFFRKTDTAFEFRYNLDSSGLENKDGDFGLIIARVPAYWYKVYLNGSLIASVGNEKRNNNFWNNSNLFIVPQNLLRDSNELIIKGIHWDPVDITESRIYLGPTGRAVAYHNLLETIFTRIYYFFIGFMLGLSFTILIIFLSNNTKSVIYLIFSLSGVCFSFYLLDYIPIYNLIVDKLLFRKFIIVCLALSQALISFAVYKITGKKLVRNIAAISLILFLIAPLIIQNPYLYKRSYHYLNILFPINFCIWIYAASKSYRVSQPARIIFFLSILCLFTSAVDIVNMMFKITDFKMSMYILIFTMICYQLITISLLINEEKQITVTHELLKKERSLLDKALRIDEVSELYNQRQLHDIINSSFNGRNEEFAVILLEIDNLSLINKSMGFKNGDRIIQALSGFIRDYVHDKEKIFRYTGLQFLMIIERSNNMTAFEIAESIRKRVLASEEIQRLSGCIPVGISAGIAYFLRDAVDFHGVVSKAEQALMYARKKGSNRTILFDTDITKLLEAGHSDFIKNELLMDFVISLANAIDAKDSYTGFHSQEVARYALLIAEAMGLDEEKKYYLRIGGMLHDVGKLGIPDLILQKSSNLTNDEFSVIKSHTTIGFNIAHQIFHDSDIIFCVRNHHERWDGSGYPDHLKEEKIPLLSRIICVADAYHAMISTRVYRNEMSKKQAVNQLIENSGRQFDPNIVSSFLQCIL